MQIIYKTEDLFNKLDFIKKNDEFITIDTEFVREKTYFPNLGLIQIGFSGGEFVVDPISKDLDLEILQNILQDEKITKVFHASQQDLEILLNQFGNLPRNIFDTQIAGKILGFGEAVSYSKLVEHYCDVNIDKSARFTDWLKRPLSENQISYALDDVTYLKDVYLKINNALKKRNRLSWATEEMQKLLDENLYRTNPNEAWHKIKFRSNDQTYLKILRNLADWRERKAMQLNKPRMWIMKDDAIQEIAFKKPRKASDLSDARFIKCDERTSQEIIEQVNKAFNDNSELNFEKNISISDNLMPIVTLLKILLRNQSIENDVAPTVICDVEELKKIANGEFKNNKAMQGWRYDVFGYFAKKLVEGKLALSARGKNVFIIDLETQFE